jgi:hypothetical protein
VHDSGHNAPLPDVDFTREIVLAASAYVREPPDRFVIDSIATDGDSVVAITTIEKSCSIARGVSHITLLARVPETSKPVRFLERRRQGPDCARTERRHLFRALTRTERRRCA